MTEQKRPRPPWVETISLPGHRPTSGAPSPEQLIMDVRQGVLSGLFERGSLLPEVTRIREMYALGQADVLAAITCLKQEEVIQYHDEYQDIYFIDYHYGLDEANVVDQSDPSAARPMT
ncbi:hypothetical protein [Streptomyces sp. NPDC002889]|uniref:hypothetical protein n=1 Tax=Streptomyces sp. NPDC002889 TaxID=3364669 RepID=UPI003684787C